MIIFCYVISLIKRSYYTILFLLLRYKIFIVLEQFLTSMKQYCIGTQESKNKFSIREKKKVRDQDLNKKKFA